MKIVYLIAGTFNAGGMERVLTNKVNWLAAHGYEVSVVTTDQRGRLPYFKLDERIQTYDLGINYDEDNGRLLGKLLHYPIRQWQHRRRLTRLLVQSKADVVICMFNNDVSFAYKIKDGSHKVLEAHFSKNKKLQYGRRGLWALADRWRTWREEHIVSKYERFVVLTHEDAQLWGRLKNICVIPNARTFEPKGQAALTEKRVLAIGRYDYQKGFDTLINIWKEINDNEDDNEDDDENDNENDNEKLRSASPLGFSKQHALDPGCLTLHESLTINNEANSWTLDIVGDGPLRETLQQQVERLGLQDSVRLLMPTDNIEEAYLNASVFVMTSRYEGLPMVLLEAQACGLPAIAFACPCGPRDIITDGVNGYLIEDNDTQTFSDRLLMLMGDVALRQRMGEAAVKDSERFTEESIMPQWQAVFQNQ